MATLLNRRNGSTIEDIWSTTDDFISDLGSYAPPYFANEYLIDSTIKANIQYAYNLILNSYKDNFIIGNLDKFKVNFTLTFIDNITAYYSFISGDITKIKESTAIGDFTFSGEQTTKQDKAFETPNQSGKYSFRQKSGQDLIDELKTYSGQLGEFVDNFNVYFWAKIN